MPRAEGAPLFFSEIPNFILGIAENCRKFRTVWEYQLQNQFSLLITNCVTTDLGTTYAKRDPLVAEGRGSNNRVDSKLNYLEDL